MPCPTPELASLPPGRESCWDLMYRVAKALLASIALVFGVFWVSALGAPMRFEQVFGRAPRPMIDGDLIREDHVLGALYLTWSISVELLCYTWFLFPALPWFVGGRLVRRSLLFFICSLAVIAYWRYWTDPSTSLLWLMD
ncbi:MAG: hypothetical protein RL885_29495 [Planctomycetota bacterium]